MKTKLKPMPSPATDADAKRLVADADISNYDLSDVKPMRFEFEPKAAAREAIKNYEATPTDSLELVKQRVLAASAGDSLQAHIRRIVADNRQKAEHQKVD